jgi:hypothetical protein
LIYLSVVRKSKQCVVIRDNLRFRRLHSQPLSFRCCLFVRSVNSERFRSTDGLIELEDRLAFTLARYSSTWTTILGAPTRSASAFIASISACTHGIPVSSRFYPQTTEQYRTEHQRFPNQPITAHLPISQPGHLEAAKPTLAQICSSSPGK